MHAHTRLFSWVAKPVTANDGMAVATFTAWAHRLPGHLASPVPAQANCNARQCGSAGSTVSKGQERVLLGFSMNMAGSMRKFNKAQGGRGWQELIHRQVILVNGKRQFLNNSQRNSGRSPDTCTELSEGCGT